jgi:glycosyltransferase involved in cell wall biosynthesis
VSVILLDWGVRESFHSLYYLNRQTASRDSYELIWLEFYDRRPDQLSEMFARGNPSGEPALDSWIVAGYPDDRIFNKHRLYNLGILAASGDVCVFCDSDAIFTPTFIEKVIAHFQHSPRTVLHIDEVRNSDPRLYPFRYPEMTEVLGPAAKNWRGTITRGLDDSKDMLHEANYGACMAARREDLIAVGGADEHLDYIGYICGPYEMTFRLANADREEQWLGDEFLYHTWHPNENGINTDYQGPHDGLYVSLRALEARAAGRVLPCVENPWLARARQGEAIPLPTVLGELVEKEEPNWRVGCQPADGDVYWMERDFQGFNIYRHRNRWYGVRIEEAPFDPLRVRRYRPLLDGVSQERVQNLIRCYNRVPSKLWAQIRCQPLYQLPYRIVRRLGKELAQLVR